MTATKKANKFPALIHLTLKNEGTEDQFYAVTTGNDVDALTTTDKTQVATYRLVEVSCYLSPSRSKRGKIRANIF